jgi:hypothetical protein
MKRRQGFVSNSSSSSFIIAVDKDVENKDIRIEISIEDCIEKRLSTIEEVQKYFLDQYGEADQTFGDMLVAEGEWFSAQYDMCVEEIENEREIIFGRASNEDDTAASLSIYHGALNEIDQDDIFIIDAGE